MQLKEDKRINKTPLHSSHIGLEAKMVDFSGWSMPLHYKEGITSEHLATRKGAGLFDISHMGRLIVSGKDSLAFLQYVLTSNAAAIEVGESQYTIISDKDGIAIDDAYLYRFYSEKYLLVVNALNSKKDKEYLLNISRTFNGVRIDDITNDYSMLSLQGPGSKGILLSVISSGNLPEPLRNKLSIIKIGNIEVLIARTGYTGEPIGFELFTDSKKVTKLWTSLLSKGASPVGLGARDTLRLEAGLPLYGHELGVDSHGCKIPVFASPQSRIPVSFSPLKGNYIGRESLNKQFTALEKILNKNYSSIGDLPKMIMPIELLEKGITRPGDKVYFKDSPVGYITSGTIIPYWISENINWSRRLSDRSTNRSIALALIDSRRFEQDIVEIKIRGKSIKAAVMPYLLRSEAPPQAYSISYGDILKKDIKSISSEKYLKDIEVLIEKTLDNSIWRQKECINLIPSEMTQSKIVKILSNMDPSGRYAEHKKLKAYADLEVFYYQGTGFISEVEKLLGNQLKKYLGCRQVETRVISGQMANASVFSALVDFLNRTNRKSEPTRLPRVLNHHIIKGGHLSSQPMGALKDFVAIDPVSEKPAVIDFPTLADNPYKIDSEETKKIITEYKPRLIIFGKSMMLYREPVSEIRAFVNDIGLDTIIMYDMAHVLGLIGPYFQKPFSDGTDIVTGSTHKTFFGTQRGIIASDWKESILEYKLWETIESRTFPGNVSNHHLGTLLGLLAAAYEMNYFKDSYQKQVISNAKAFASSLSEAGLKVAGDPKDGYTETHQVLIEVGSFNGPEIAARLEDNNIITNYQATSEEEGFTASGAIRMGVAEMTRFGMKAKDFIVLANYINEVVNENKNIKDKVKKFRSKFLDMQYCFDLNKISPLINKLYRYL